MNKALKLSISILALGGVSYISSCPLCQMHAARTAEEVAYNTGNQAYLHDLEKQNVLRHSAPSQIQDEDIVDDEILLNDRNLHDKVNGQVESDETINLEAENIEKNRPLTKTDLAFQANPNLATNNLNSLNDNNENLEEIEIID